MFSITCIMIFMIGLEKAMGYSGVADDKQEVLTLLVDIFKREGLQFHITEGSP